MSNYLTTRELAAVGLARVGNDVWISRDSRIYGAGNIVIGDHVRIDDFVVISAGAPVTLGRNVHIAAYCALFGRHGILMDDFSGLSSRVTIYTASDDYSGQTLTNPTVPDAYKALTAGAVHLGRHVIVGAGSVLLPGVVIGAGAAVGSLSLVTRDVADWTIVAGSPAKPIKNRSRGLLELERRYLEEPR